MGERYRYQRASFGEDRIGAGVFWLVRCRLGAPGIPGCRKSVVVLAKASNGYPNRRCHIDLVIETIQKCRSVNMKQEKM